MSDKTMDDKSVSRYLAMDTSTASMTVGVLENGTLLGELNTNAERNHSIGLLPNIRDLLSSLEVKAKDLQAVAVGNGPGSYTGVRIAVTVAKTFAWSLGLDLIGVSSLEAMAFGGRRRWLEKAQSRNDNVVGSSWIIPLMDARRNQAFTGVYEAAGLLADGSWRNVFPDGIHVMDKWVEQLFTALTVAVEPPRRVIFVGETDGFAACMEQFAAGWKGSTLVTPHQLQARDIGSLAYPKLRGGDLEDVHTFVPNYTQLAEAEAKLLAQANKGEGL
jgi:tRNA threonylcarbamoyladenosine biosynthesis protein TsaB